MNDIGSLWTWLAVLVFVVGAFILGLQFRNWYDQRNKPDPIKPELQNIPNYEHKFSLRRLK